MQFFVIYIGGRAGNSNIEVHDVRFAFGDKIEDCYPQLRNEWWGDASSLHLDCWGALTYADGFDISLQSTPYNGDEKLYFVNLGGYNKHEFSELHKNVFVVAHNEDEAKTKAVSQVAEWDLPHRDVLLDVDSVVCMHSALGVDGMHIHLTKTDQTTDFTFTCNYVPIGK